MVVLSTSICLPWWEVLCIWLFAKTWLWCHPVKARKEAAAGESGTSCSLQHCRSEINWCWPSTVCCLNMVFHSVWLLIKVTINFESKRDCFCRNPLKVCLFNSKLPTLWISLWSDTEPVAKPWINLGRLSMFLCCPALARMVVVTEDMCWRKWIGGTLFIK